MQSYKKFQNHYNVINLALQFAKLLSFEGNQPGLAALKIWQKLYSYFMYFKWAESIYLYNLRKWAQAPVS